MKQNFEDVNSTLKNHHDSQHSHEASEAPLHALACTLSPNEMLAARSNGDARNALEDINEIVALCGKLLTLDTPPARLIKAFEALTQAVLDDSSRGKKSKCLDQAIGCLRGALDVSPVSPPGFHHLSLNLAKLLIVRFLTFETDDDYQEAKKVLHNITVITQSLPGPPRVPPDPYQIHASMLTSALGLARSIIYSNLGDWEGAVSCCRSFLEHCPLFGDPLHSSITELLASRAERVSRHFSPPPAIQAPNSDIDHLPFYSQLGTFGDGSNGSDVVQIVPSLTAVEEKIKRLRHLFNTILPGTDRQRKCLYDLVRSYNVKVSLTQDVTAMEEAINYRRILLATTHPSDPSTFLHLSSFANFLHSAFNRTNKVEYLDESIAVKFLD